MAKKERHSESIAIEQPAPLVMPELDQALEHERQIIEPNEEVLQKQYADALAFNREPITIGIEPCAEENPPLFIDCWVNGKGCEIFQNGQWLALGAFPVGVEIVTRRMYVEVLARAKRMTVRTLIHNPTAEKPKNRIHRSVSQRAAFTVIEDRNPKGAAWLRSVVNFGV